jgi:ABC-type lipoprotein release transport system permease subunit
LLLPHGIAMRLGMNRTSPRTPRRHRVLARAWYAFNFFAIALAIATLVAVERVMAAFRIEMRESVVAKSDPAVLASFEKAVAHELNASFGILAMTVLLASLFISGASFLMLRKSK